MDNYDPKMRELVDKKTKIRMALRNEYIKQLYNPHRHATGEGGILFDPGHQRYMTMSTNRYLYFKPSPKTSFLGVTFILVPFVSICYYMMKWKNDEEHRLATGQVSYKDRWNKFM
uniref:NADH dehydrogenase [ubiquinone] 1 beta subcomplex subunit 4 n=1 Tax=Cacopsylla melanoneura TaxID=428564 RepID=A0A8D9AUE6_9HEMI